MEDLNLEKLRFEICPKCGKPHRPRLGRVVWREPDTILDPMAGTGSTVILAALMGRHGIAVEYEPRFCDMIRANIELTERQATLTPKGRMACIQGDARELSKLLGESDAIVTSPPYSECEHDYRHGLKELRDNFKGRRAWEGRERVELSEQNIGRLPHGDIDSIITSPPYSEGIGHDSGDEASEEYKERLEMQRKYTRQMVSEGNIANLKHGDIDAVVTSPPFGPSTKGGGIFKEGYRAPGEEEVSDPGLPQRHGRPLSDDPRNIDNLPYGESVDAVITSPPYEATCLDGRDAERRAERLKEAGHDPKDFLGGRGRDATLKDYDKVDTVITSPPYEGSVPAYDEKWLEEHWDDESESPKHKTMRFGRSMRGYPKKVDAVVTSPPYGNRLADDVVDDGDEARMSYRQAIDSIVTSPPYEEGLRHRGQDYEEVREKLLAQGYSEEYIRASWSQPHQCQRWAEETYGEDERNIGNLKGETYLSSMLQCYREMWKVLKDKGKLIVVIKNFIREKAVVRLDLDTIRLCEAAGFRLADRWYFKLPLKSFWRILYSKRFPHVPEVEFEDVLVFEKGKMNGA